jgi:hypothetical protein
MFSDFDELFATFAAPALVEQFADRDSNGDLAKALYHSPKYPAAAAPKELVGPIWSEVRFEDVPDIEGGGYMRRETRTCQILRSELEAAHVAGFERGAWLDDPGGEAETAWMLEETTTVWGEVFVTFGLVRIPLVTKNELRSAAV